VGSGLFSSKEESARMSRVGRTFEVAMAEAERTEHRRRWADAVARTRSQRA
jgi:glycerol kinase